MISTAQQYFNVSQTDVVIFDQFVTDLFWTQTISSVNGTACQMSPPQIDSNQTTWNLSELNLVFKYAPFYHWQGVPIIFTRISSSGIDSSNFQTNGDKIVIQYSSTSRLLVENIRNLQGNSAIQ